LCSAVGRDKSLRLVQYFSRFYAWYLYRTNNPQSAIDPYDAAKKQVGLTRKILRVGKFVEHFKAAATAADSTTVTDPLLKYLAVARQLGYAGYLALDAMTVVRLRKHINGRAKRGPRLTNGRGDSSTRRASRSGVRLRRCSASP
jgi:hypothetical protein